MSKGKKCTSRECQRFERSQAAHLCLAKKYSGASPYGKAEQYRHLQRYHTDVFQRQREFDRLLTSSEKKRSFNSFR